MHAKRLIKRFVVVTACVVPIALVAFVFVNINWGIDDAYAKWGAADLVIDYMRTTHDGRWPRDWEAIGPLYGGKGGRLELRALQIADQHRLQCRPRRIAPPIAGGRLRNV
jgi:hypothetical protein